MQFYEFKLPDIGEGIAEGEIVKWLVAEGDIIKEDQPLVEVMTDKVNVEIPSPKAGKIAKVLAKAGEVVDVGQSIVVFEVEEGSETEKTVPASSAQKEIVRQKIPNRGLSERAILATPATRKLAKDLGIDITQIVGSGPEGRVSAEDVKRTANGNSGKQQRTASALVSKQSDERVPLRGIRRTIAGRMLKSTHLAAQVTHVDEADVTDLVLLRNQLKSQSGVSRITFLPLFIRAVVPALKEFPYMNALFDDERQEIVLKKYYNIGIASDTEQGLVVTVLKEADNKDIFSLANEIEALVEKARTGRLSLDEVHDSTFTITSVGSIGGLSSTPLMNYPEVAILGIQRITKKPVVKEDSIVIRDMMNLSLSFDHRVIDGAYAARFLNRVIENIQKPNSLTTR